MQVKAFGVAGVAAAILGLACAHAEPVPAAGLTAAPTPETKLMSAAVASSDLAKSIDFYTRGLGLTVAARLENPKATEVVLAFPGGGANLMLLKAKTEGEPLSVRGAMDRVVIATPDLEALQARLVAAGYALKGPINREPRFHVAVGNVSDPDGNVIELVQGGR